MIFSFVSMTSMSCFSGSICVFTASPLEVLTEVVGRKPPPLRTTCDMSSPTPWMDLITLLPETRAHKYKHQQTCRSIPSLSSPQPFNLCCLLCPACWKSRWRWHGRNPGFQAGSWSVSTGLWSCRNQNKSGSWPNSPPVQEKKNTILGRFAYFTVEKIIFFMVILTSNVSLFFSLFPKDKFGLSTFLR